MSDVPVLTESELDMLRRISTERMLQHDGRTVSGRAQRRLYGMGLLSYSGKRGRHFYLSISPAGRSLLASLASQESP